MLATVNRNNNNNYNSNVQQQNAAYDINFVMRASVPRRRRDLRPAATKYPNLHPNEWCEAV